jgi:uncharacterized protein YqeY
MSSLAQKLDEAFKQALKDRQPVAASTLRLLKSAMQYRAVELKRPLNDAELQAVIATQVKQRREAMAEYAKAQRPDLAKKEEEELGVLLSFLPPQLSPEDLKAELAAILQDIGAKGPQDLGKVMKTAMARLAGRTDGKTVNELARQLLSS